VTSKTKAPAFKNGRGEPLGVLLVEDETLVADTLRDALEELGCDVVGWAISASDAERLAAATPPDVIFMDIRIKGWPDGIGTARRLRERCSAPIVFVTGIGSADTLERARQVSPAGLLQKPFTQDDIRRILSAVSPWARASPLLP
jgi:DNA-binding NarL/FixJ family response regulator